MAGTRARCGTKPKRSRIRSGSSRGAATRTFLSPRRWWYEHDTHRGYGGSSDSREKKYNYR